MNARMRNVLLMLAVPLVSAVAVSVTLLATDEDANTPDDTVGPTIQIENFEYEPSPLKVGSGETITIVNIDSTTHTVTADEGDAFDTGDIDGGGQATITAGAPGSYGFFCAIHDYMRGEIQVTP